MTWVMITVWFAFRWATLMTLSAYMIEFTYYPLSSGCCGATYQFIPVRPDELGKCPCIGRNPNHHETCRVLDKWEEGKKPQFGRPKGSFQVKKLHAIICSCSQLYEVMKCSVRLRVTCILKLGQVKFVYIAYPAWVMVTLFIISLGQCRWARCLFKWVKFNVI